MRTKAYKSRSGEKLFKISIEYARELDDDYLGFCIACRHTQSAEPDARKYVCEACGKPKVYGAAELAMMGLTF